MVNYRLISLALTPLNQKGHTRREAAYQQHPVVHHVQMAWGDIQ